MQNDPDAPVSPTPERWRRGVELVDNAIADDEGRPAQPYRSIDILAAMERRGAITSEMRQAGEEFQELFRMAHLDPLMAADLSRPFVSGATREAISYRIERARRSVWQTLLDVGGVGSVSGSCVWHVLGWQKSIKEWATEQALSGRRLSQGEASWVLISVLGMLAGREIRS